MTKNAKEPMSNNFTDNNFCTKVVFSEIGRIVKEKEGDMGLPTINEGVLLSISHVNWLYV